MGEDIETRFWDAGSIVPVCANCNSIRLPDDRWVCPDDSRYKKIAPMKKGGEVKYSHGLCNSCLRVLYPDMADEIIRG
jgi:hypothetical protein